MFMSFLPYAAGAVVSFVLGALWYSPVMFGKQWQRLMAFKHMGKITFGNMAPLLLASVLCSLLMSYVLGSLLMVLSVVDPLVGLQVGFLVWLGFVGPTSLLNALYGKKSLKLYVLDNGYHLVSLMVMGFLYVLLVR